MKVIFICIFIPIQAIAVLWTWGNRERVLFTNRFRMDSRRVSSGWWSRLSSSWRMIPSSIHASLIYRQILFCVIEFTKHRHMIVLGRINTTDHEDNSVIRTTESYFNTLSQKKRMLTFGRTHMCVRRSGTCVEETTPDFSRRRDDVGKRKENGITKGSTTTRDISTSFSPR